MQRSAGNSAVVGLLAARHPLAERPALARKKVTISTQFLAAAGGASAALNLVAAAVKRYNAGQSKATPLGRLELLWSLDQAIYGFCAGRASPKLKGQDVDAVGKLFRSRRTSMRPSSTPTAGTCCRCDRHTRLAQAEVDAATKLWSSIVASRGRILVAGTAAYTRRTLANLAKIMRTPTGRRLLAYLNAGKPEQDIGKRVCISDVLPPELATPGLDVNKKYYARGLGERATFASDKAQDVKHTGDQAAYHEGEQVPGRSGAVRLHQRRADRA